MAFSITSENSADELREGASFRVPEIRGFVTKSLLRHIDDQENFFETGFVTSMFGMQLITFLEQRYGIEVLDDDLDLANFCTLINIAIFVDRKLG
jgi:methoxymalonate biosynthesis acyl carrier protein